MTPGGGRSWIRTPRAPAPPTACSRGVRDRRANPRQRPGTTHGPHRGAASDNEPEQYGGRAPHDLSIANKARNVARTGRAEGRTGAERPPGPQAPRPPLLGGGSRAAPPPPARLARRRQAAPGARCCPATPTERVHHGGMHRRRRGGLGREPQAAPPRGRGGEPRGDPPPVAPAPPTGPQATRAPAPIPPEAEGTIPPPPGRNAAPERESGAGPAPTP